MSLFETKRSRVIEEMGHIFLWSSHKDTMAQIQNVAIFSSKINNPKKKKKERKEKKNKLEKWNEKHELYINQKHTST